MRKVTLLVLVLGLLSVGVAMAAPGGYGADYADEAYEGARLSVGYVSPDMLDDTIVYGGSYIWKNALVDVAYFTSDGPFVSGVTPGTVDANVLTAEASYLFRAETDPSMYYGAGIGFASVDWNWSDLLGVVTDSGTDTGLLYHVVVGKEFYREGEYGGSNWFLEARYSFGENVAGLSVDGFRINAGWRF